MDDELREEISRVIRHDLRSPLAVIITQCDLLDEGIGDVASATERIRRQALNMVTLLDKIGDKLH